MLITRLDQEKAVVVTQALPVLSYNELARTATCEQPPIAPLGKLPVALVCAGTADVPMGEECAETLRLLGIRVERLYDVGVAGIHRLFGRRELFDRTAWRLWWRVRGRTRRADGAGLYADKLRLRDHGLQHRQRLRRAFAAARILRTADRF